MGVHLSIEFLVEHPASLSRGRTVALVPARAGSKGIPRKNLKVVGGRTLVEWAFVVAQQCERITDVCVSTDDEEVAEIAEAHNAMVIWRPENIAQDHAPMSAVLEHALGFMGDFESLCLLEPTSPLRYPKEISAVLNILDHHPSSVVTTVHLASEAPELMYKAESGGALVQVWQGNLHGRRQDRPRYHLINGLIYAARKQLLLKSANLRDHPLHGLETEIQRSISIDTVADLERVSDWLNLHPSFPRTT